ncbi:MAG TPA: hypothetical protein VMH81_15295 [Bryobacteraceae bacterium]|nr:hypothetical protein [Bryobacteraceae bacterium]
MRNRSRLLSGIGLPLVFVLAGSAQERPNGFFLTSPLGLSSGYDDHFLTSSRTLDDNVSFLTTPTLAWFTSTHRTLFSVDYQAEFEIFSHYTNLDAWNHNANLHFRHQITSRLSVDGADSFLFTNDPTRKLNNSLLLLPAGRYQENDFYTRLAYRLDHKTVLSARIDSAYTSMDLPAYVQARLNRVGFAETFTVDRTINSHHALSGSYSYLYVHPLESGFGQINTGAHNVNLGYVYTVNPGLTLRATGGVTRSVQSSFTGAAAVDKKVGDVWLSAGYQRYLAFFSGLTPTPIPVSPVPIGVGFAPNSIYQVVALRAWGKITRRVGVEGNAQRALNGTTTDNRGIKSIMLQLRLDYKLNDRVTLFTRTEFYGQNFSEFTPFPMSRRRYFAGVEYTLSRAPELADDPHRHKPLPPNSDQPPAGDSHPQEDR